MGNLRVDPTRPTKSQMAIDELRASLSEEARNAIPDGFEDMPLTATEIDERCRLASLRFVRAVAIILLTPVIEGMGRIIEKREYRRDMFADDGVWYGG